MTVEKPHLILASGSATRRAMLEAAGVAFDVMAADVDEPALRAAYVQQQPQATSMNIAEMLAAAKALSVSLANPSSLVIGSDQVLDVEGELLSKPGDDAGVRATLQKLSGKTHELHAAVTLAQGGQLLWTASDTAQLTMRPLSPAFIDEYIARAGSGVRTSVGAYQIEGLGIQLFEHIKGDHFTILGMPLLPLLGALRKQRGSGGMKQACVIGWPIAHSRSPLIHGYWLKALGIDGDYTKVAVEPGQVEAFLQALADLGYVGCNVTVPHKETALRVADVQHSSAAAIGAANTLWLEEGKLHAANTDSYGFMTYLATRAPHWQRRNEAPVAVLGAGGAARAIVHGFLDAGVSEIRVFNRSRARAEALAKDIGPHVIVYDWSERNARTSDAGVLVNTTSVGMKGDGDLGIDVAALHRDCVVADIVYVPLQTQLLRDAAAAGLVTVDGLGMLLHQAVPGFERWFGRRPTVTDELYNLVAADVEAG